MKRIQTPTIPLAGTFLGHQSSSDRIDEGRMPSNTTTKPFNFTMVGGQQTMVKHPPEKNINIFNLASSFSWSNRTGGLQKSNSFYGKKVDNASKQDLPHYQGRQNKLGSLKSSSLSSIEVNFKTTPSSLESESAHQNHPSHQLLVPPAIPMPSSPDVASLGSIKNPPFKSSMDDSLKRIPPASFPSGSRDCTVPSRGSIKSHWHKQHLRNDVASMNLADRPQKPPRHFSNMSPGLPTPPRHQYYGGEEYLYQQQTGQELLQNHTLRRYHMRPWQQDFHHHRIHQYHRTSDSRLPSALSRHSCDEVHEEKDWASKSSRRLKDPPQPAKASPPIPSPPMSSSTSLSPAVANTCQKEVVHLEIFPGNTQILRGAEETVQALEQNFVVPCKCIACTVDHLCIADAAFVICPMCRCVSQAPDHALNVQYGVGLGFLPQYEPE
jgi:hypothetical protein